MNSDGLVQECEQLLEARIGKLGRAKDMDLAALAEEVSNLVYSKYCSKYLDTYERLAKTIAALEDKLKETSAALKKKQSECKIIKEYHVILLKKYRLLVSEKEFANYINAYDKNLKLDLTVQDDSRPDREQRARTEDKAALVNVKKATERAKKDLIARREEGDPEEARSSSHYHTINLDDTKGIGKKHTDRKYTADGRSIGKELGLAGSEISRIESPKHPQKKAARKFTADSQ